LKNTNALKAVHYFMQGLIYMNSFKKKCNLYSLTNPMNSRTHNSLTNFAGRTVTQIISSRILTAEA